MLARDENATTTLGTFPLIGAMVQAGLTCRTVPEAHWESETDGRGYSVATVSCACGHAARPGLGAYPTPRRCERWFLYTGTEVLALNGPKGSPA